MEKTFMIDHQKINAEDVGGFDVTHDDHTFTMTIYLVGESAKHAQDGKIIMDVTCDYDEKNITPESKENAMLYLAFCENDLYTELMTFIADSDIKSVNYTPVLDYMRKMASQVLNLKKDERMDVTMNFTRLAIKNTVRGNHDHKSDVRALLFQDAMVYLSRVDHFSTDVIDHKIIFTFYDHDDRIVLSKTYVLDQNVSSEALQYACKTMDQTLKTYKTHKKFKNTYFDVRGVMNQMQSLINTSKGNFQKLETSFNHEFVADHLNQYMTLIEATL